MFSPVRWGQRHASRMLALRIGEINTVSSTGARKAFDNCTKYPRHKAPSDHEEQLLQPHHKAIVIPSVPKPGGDGGTVTSSEPCSPGPFCTCSLRP